MYEYAIVLKSENKVIGGIGIYDKVHDESKINLKQNEVGYVLNPTYWGRGIMVEAVGCLCDYAFSELGTDLMWCCHFDFNNRSRRVIEKYGFEYKFEKEKELTLLDNKKVKLICYNMSKEQWKSKVEYFTRFF